MISSATSCRSFWLTTILCVLGLQEWTVAQAANASQAGNPRDGYRIAGTVVSKSDGHPLARALVVVRSMKDAQNFHSLVTAEDGKFEFNGLPAGKYSLNGAKRGFITSAYDQHERFSSAIVTGADLETETLLLRLAPAAVISGKILDESGEPVRRASVTLYYDDHSSGVDQIHQIRGASTDDQGAYEMLSLTPGTYFLAASAKPWYAVHPQSYPSGSKGKRQSEVVENFDRSLDVAYPLTYYPDVVDADSATPIPIRGGEHLQVDIHLNPVRSLHLLFRVPTNGNIGFNIPQLEQSTFDGSTFLQNDGVHIVSQGLVEITGVPAGRYNVRLNGQGAAVQMSGVDLVKDGEEIDTSSGEPLSSVKVSAQVLGEASLPERLSIGLRSAHRALVGVKVFDAKGDAELQQIPSGRYEVLLWGPPKPYSIAHMSAEGATVSGRTLTLPPGASASVSLTIVAGSSNVEGTAKREGKPFAGAMVVLVPKNPEMNRDLFRRDQSDLDGTFSLRDVIPGTYTVLAIENGWDLDWSQPAIIAAYVNHGRKLEVGNQVGRTTNLPAAVEVQSK
jgi:hypothetical protein